MCGGDFIEVYNDPSQVGKKSTHRESVYVGVVVIFRCPELLVKFR